MFPSPGSAVTSAGAVSPLTGTTTGSPAAEAGSLSPLPSPARTYTWYSLPFVRPAIPHGFSVTGSTQAPSPGYAPWISVVAHARYDTVPVPAIGCQLTMMVPSPGSVATP